MASVDDKVVSMSFESSKFESGVSAAINALNKLKSALSFPSAGKGFDQVAESASKVDLNPISKALDFLKGKFSSLGVIGMTVLNNITNKIVDAGLKLAKSFVLDPITAGFHNYETQINAVQTIMANTGLTGQKGLGQVQAALDELNTYANKTVYNFSEMAKNIGTFTAAGVDLKTSVASIKGIANLAALSGSTSEQASTAMYQLSQAIASGTTKLQDWNSVVNAGMGGKVFQKALYDTGVAMHTIKGAKLDQTFEQWTNSGNSFRESLKSGWLTSKVMTTTLKGLTGDMTDAQLKAEGYSASQIKYIQQIAKSGVAAAVNIKTLSQLTQALKEEVATAWSAIFKTIFGNIFTATKLFTSIHNVAETALTAPIYKLNQLLEGWAKLGGRTILIDALKEAWRALGMVMAPIKAAFREIFPATTAKQLVDITVAFHHFVEELIPSPATVDNLKRTFAGLFAVLDIGKQLLSGIFTVFKTIFAQVASGGGSFLNLTGNVGDFLVSIDKALKEGGKLHNFFVGLGQVLAKPIQFIEKMAAAIGSLFSGFSSKGSGAFSGIVGGMAGALSPLQKVLAGAKLAWDRFWQGVGDVAAKLKPGFQAIGQEIGNLGQQLAQGLSNINWAGLMDIIRTGLLGGMYLVFKKFFSGSLGDMLGGGIMKSIGETFDGLTGVLKNMQQTVKAATLLEIAGAVGILTGSIVAMSMIPTANLDKAIAGVAMAMGELVGAMAILNKIPMAGFTKIPILAGSMILLATAIDILSVAVGHLGGMSWDQLAKGLAAVGALLVGISVAAQPLSKSTVGLISAGVGITAIAVALNILALAVKQFGGMSWADLGKGMAAVAVALGAIGLAARAFPSGMITIGAGLIAVGLALKMIAGVVQSFGKLPWGAILKGMAGIAGGLVIIAGAMQLMPANMVVTAAGLLLIAVALKGVAASIESLGGQSIAALAKGIIALALALTVLAAGMYAMSGSLAGAAAMVVAAGAIALLAPAIEGLGKMSWGDIVKGMVALAAAFAVMGVAGLLLEPVAPALLALGAALIAVGAGIALVGAGIALAGVGLSAIAVSGPAAVAILLKAFTDFMNQIPQYVQNVVQALLTVVTSIANAAPQFVTALGKILVSLSQAVVAAAPQIAVAFGALIQAALRVITQNFPNIVNAGLQMIIAMLKGIANAIPQLVTQVTNIIVNFLNALSANLPRIQAAGWNLMFTLVFGMGTNMPKVVQTGIDAVGHFVSAVAGALGSVASVAGSLISRFANTISSVLGQVSTEGASAVSHFVSAVGAALGSVVSEGAKVISSLVSGIAGGVGNAASEGAKAVSNLVNGVGGAVSSAFNAGYNVGKQIVNGMISGIGSLAGSLVSKAEGVVSGAVNAAKHLLHIGSPSKVFYDIGVDTIQGMILGIGDQTDNAVTAVETMAQGLIDSMSSVPTALAGMTDMNPTITPVLDLTQVQEGANQMTDMIGTAAAVPATVSYGQASSISATQPGQTPTTDSTGQPVGGITYIQNNTSPDSLSEIEIYRQTKNQLSQLKSALAIG